MNNFLFWISSTWGIGKIQITWYATFILIGVCIGFVYLIREGKRIGLSVDDIYTGVIIGLPSGIVGARLWYILFNLDAGWTFQRIIGLDGGLAGLAIQGGVIGASISLLIFAKVKKIPLYKVFDVAAVSILMAQILGRLGNFCNHELYGPVIENSYILKYIPILGENMYISGSYRHPVFLYEMILNIIGVGVILSHKQWFKRTQSGDIMGLYLVWYGMARIPCELLRMNSGVSEPLMLGDTGIPVSIALSIIFIVGGGALLIVKRFVGPKKLYSEVVKEALDARFDTIIFDNDGTLVDTKQLIFNSFIYTFKKFRPDKELTEEELDSFFGPTLYQTFSRFSEDEKEIEEMIAYYREYNVKQHDDMVSAFPGAKSVLKTLHKKKYKIAVVSSKKTDLLTHGLDITGLLPYIDLVIGADEVTAHKPAPDGILLAKEKLEGKNCLYVGDTLIDMEAAKNANVKSCGVLYISHPEIMLEAKPDYVISKMDELLKICGE